MVRALLILVGIALAVAAFAQDASAPAGARRPDSPWILQMRAYLTRALQEPELAALSAAEKNAVAAMAIGAASIIDAGACEDPSVGGGAMEIFLFTFVAMAKRELAPVLALPEARKAELVNLTMTLESRRPTSKEAAASICAGNLLPQDKVPALAQRRDTARQVLAMVLAQAAGIPADAMRPPPH